MTRNTFSKIVKKYIYLIYGKSINTSQVNKLFLTIEKIFKLKKKKKNNRSIMDGERYSFDHL